MSLRGFSTISFWADDVAAATARYAEFLGVQAYNPHYVEVLASTTKA